MQNNTLGWRKPSKYDYHPVIQGHLKNLDDTPYYLLLRIMLSYLTQDFPFVVVCLLVFFFLVACCEVLGKILFLFFSPQQHKEVIISIQSTKWEYTLLPSGWINAQLKVGDRSRTFYHSFLNINWLCKLWATAKNALSYCTGFSWDSVNKTPMSACLPVICALLGHSVEELLPL